MANFDPDQYLAEKVPFNPDQYLQEKGAPMDIAQGGTADAARAVDNPPAGAEIPGEQRVINTLNTVGQGAALPSLVNGAAQAAKFGLSKIIPGAAEDLAQEAPRVAEGAAGAAKEAPAVGATQEAIDPLKDVKDYINSKYGEASAKPGFTDKIARQLNHESLRMAAHDLGIQPRQGYQMGPGLEGPEKLEALTQYALDQGYVRPGLSNLDRRAMFQQNLDKYGQQVGALRDMASQRGPGHDLPSLIQAVKTQLDPKYLSGEFAAPQEYQRALEGLAKADPSYSGIADKATSLNKAATDAGKMSQSKGPFTDVANIISRMNNDAIKKTLNPEEAKMYEESLRNFGAHKALENVLGRSAVRDMASRTNQRGIGGKMLQEMLDRVGYQFGSNVANRMAKSVAANPNVAKSLPQFFEELEHHVGDVADDAVAHFSQGGLVTPEMAEWIKKHQ